MPDTYKGTPLTELFEWDEDQRLVLPNFQRAFEWSRSDQKALVASFISDIPIGSILLLKGQGNDYASRPLCLQTDDTSRTGECKYLLDGQQRISTLKGVFDDAFRDHRNWRDAYDSLYPKLQNRWFIRVVPDTSDEDDLFGWENLIFDKERLAVEPATIKKYIEYYRVLVRDKEVWKNPQYITEVLENLSEGERNLHLAREAARESLVPLFDLRNGVSGKLHKKVLQEIAEERSKQLLSKVEENRAADLFRELKAAEEQDIIELLQSDSEERRNTGRIQRATRWATNVTAYLESIPEREVATIELDSDEMSRAIPIFENLNQGGTKLSVFDLIVARAAAGESGAISRSLRVRVCDNLRNEMVLPESLQPGEWSILAMEPLEDQNIPIRVVRDQYLNLLSVFSFFEHGNFSEGEGEDEIHLKVDFIKKKEILNLSSQQINSNSERTVDSLKRAFAFLQMRCGIVSVNDLAYSLMVLPVAYAVRDDAIWNDKDALDKIEYWYWTSIFGGAYREKQNRRCINDIQKLHRWLKDEIANPFETRREQVLKVQGYSDEDVLTLKNPEEYPVPGAVKTTLLQYVLSRSPEDFLSPDLFGENVRLSARGVAENEEFSDQSGQTYQMTLEEHHIMPLAEARTLSVSAQELRSQDNHILNSPLNKTWISKTANQQLSSSAPEDYLERIAELSRPDHCLPQTSSFNKRDGEPEVERYERLAGDRYERLKSTLSQELRELARD